MCQFFQYDSGERRLHTEVYCVGCQMSDVDVGESPTP
jgi:hypothetical protein